MVHQDEDEYIPIVHYAIGITSLVVYHFYDIISDSQFKINRCFLDILNEF